MAKRLAALGIRTAPVQKPARAKVDRTVEGFDAGTWSVTPPTKETFWKVLEQRGVRFTEVSNPTQCPIHDSGPVDEAALAAVVEELRALCKQPVTLANTRRRKALSPSSARCGRRWICTTCTCGSTRSSAPRCSSWRRTSRCALP